MGIKFNCNYCKKENTYNSKMRREQGKPKLILESRKLENEEVEVNCSFCGKPNMINTENLDGDTPTDRILSEEESFYLEWGRESQKNNLVYLNDLLGKCIPVNAALAGGAVVQTSVENETLRIIIIASFLLALIFSFLGYLPYERKIDISNPNKIKAHKEQAVNHKRTYVWIAAFFMIFGLGLALVGVIIGN